ncbi:MAG: tripartite tricarboxylate transporter TctB family protein [Alphaproteobacteria bacterium]|nr:tripartite tricarboxylate transporter TctB family protein [Alphaproteobacteria bacterium]
MSSPGPTPPPPAARGDVVGALILVAIGLFAWASSRGLAFGTLGRPGAGFFPSILSAALIVLGGIILVGGLRGAGGVDLRALREEGEGLRRAGVAAALLLGAIAIVDIVGFAIAAGLLCGLMLRRFGERGWVASAGFGLAVGLAVFLVFKLWLRVNLPLGRIFA